MAEQIERAAEQDPALATEIAEIRSMVDQLSELYKHETAGIEATSFVSPSASSNVAAASSTSGVQTVNASSQRKFNWTAAVGLLAMAASLLIAVVLAAPTLREYFNQPRDVLANADLGLASSPEVADLESMSNELQQRLDEVKQELSEEVAARRSTDSEQPQRTSEVNLKEQPFIDSLNDIDRAAISEIGLQQSHAFHDARVKGSSDGEVGGDYVEASKDAAPEVTVPDGGTVLLGGTKLSKNPAPEAYGMGGMGGEGGMGMGSAGMGGGRGMGAGGMGSAGMGTGGGMGMGGGGSGMGSGMGGPSTTTMMTITPRLIIEEEEERLYPLSDDSFSDAKGRFEYRSRGRGLGESKSNSDRYAPIYENPFKSVENEQLSTFSIDVDTASYVKTRQFLMENRALPPANAVRTEEFINYFEYEYAGPQGDDPFAANLAVATCPWHTDHKLVRIALQAKKIDVSQRPKANIVFLLDVSGSMDEPNKLPLVKESLRMMIEQLTENDRVAMVVYAGAAGCVLESTTGDKKDVILGALDRLNAGGSTNGGQGIQLAYEIARDHFVPGGVNRVILCTDGDFNVGTTNTEELVALVAENAKSKVFLTVLGYGIGNTNDAMMEQISNRGNGVYSIVDSRREAQRQMVKQLAGNLMTVAKDVKIQVEFNPDRVASYRLIGYENRMLAAADFANDKKDAGEIGAGHRVTALYEIEPIGAARVQPAAEEELRYRKSKPAVDAVAKEQTVANGETSNELLAVKLRYKQPEGDTSKLLTFPLVDANKPFVETDADFKWAASVAQFAMLLRSSIHKGNATWSGLIETASPLANDDSRRECLHMMRTAAEMSPQVGY